MRKILLTLLTLSFGLNVLAQSTLGFNYQAIIRNSSGEVIASKQIGIQLSILKNAADGEVVYTEAFTPTTNEFGLINLVVGNGTATKGTYSEILWDNTSYFLKVELDVEGGTSYVAMGTTQLLSVPFANFAFSGNPGKSAYDVWLSLGNQGTEADFIASLKGPTGETGEAGTPGEVGEAGLPGNDGKTILSGVIAPVLTQGNLGDFYLNTATSELFGPKTENGWGSSVSLIGPIGPEGPSGTTSWKDADASVSTTKKVGIGTETPTSMLEVKSDGTIKADVPLFEVKNSLGETVFAVYENSVKVFIDEGQKTRGGFAVSGRTSSKVLKDILVVDPVETKVFVDQPVDETVGGFIVANRSADPLVPSEIMKVTPDLTQVYVNESVAKTRGGFAVSGRTSSKATSDILHITPGFTKFFVDEPIDAAGGFSVSNRTGVDGVGGELIKITPALTEVFVDQAAGVKSRGGFAVSGRTSSKATLDYFHVTPDFTRVYVDEPVGKNRGGFAVSGRTSSKEDAGELLMVVPGLTQIFVDPTDPVKSRGGFAISGRTSSKAETDLFHITQEHTKVFVDQSNQFATGFSVLGRNNATDQFADVLNVSTNLTQVYVPESTKSRGGFAVSGRTSSKGTADLLHITPDFARVYVDPATGKAIGGFAVADRTLLPEEGNEILKVTPGLTEVFVEESGSKTRGGFAVSGRTSSKAGSIYDVFTVVPERTDVYVKQSTAKNSLPQGFSVTGLDEAFQEVELFSVSDQGTFVATSIAVAPKITTYAVTNIAQTTADISGKLLDAGDATVNDAGFIYAVKGSSLPTLESVANLSPSQGGMIPTGLNPDNTLNASLFDLQPGTTYVVRAYATNDNFLTGYGEAREFKTFTPSKVTLNIVDQSLVPIVGSTATVWPLGAPTPIYSGPSSTHVFNLPNGTHTYSIEAPGFRDSVDYNFVVNGDIVQQIILIPSTEPKVNFIVVNQHGERVQNTRIDIPSLSLEAYTDAQGRAPFLLAPGTYTYGVLVLETEGYLPHPGGEVTVTTDLVQTVNITIEEKQKVVFLIKYPSGNPPGQMVDVLVYDGENEYSGFADYGSGKAVIYDIPVGTYDYSVTTMGTYPDATGTITVVLDQDLTVNVSLVNHPTNYPVLFRIHNENSDPVNGATVVLESSPNYYEYAVSGTVTAGEASFSNVPVGAYTYRVSASGYPIQEQTIDVNHYSSFINEEGVLVVDVFLMP